jgi:hypothetical protein
MEGKEKNTLTHLDKNMRSKETREEKNGKMRERVT